MDNIAYAALVAFGAFTTGMALMALYFYVASMRVVRGTTLSGHFRRHLWLAVTKAGIVVTQSVLLVRIISVGSLDASPAVVWFLTGLAVTGVGVMGQCAMMYRDLPLFEEEARNQKQTEAESVARGNRPKAEEAQV